VDYFTIHAGTLAYVLLTSSLTGIVSRWLHHGQVVFVNHKGKLCTSISKTSAKS
jgi:hypothetical protein